MVFVWYFVLCGLVTYTTDSESYQTMLELDIKRDFLYNIISEGVVKRFNSDYFVMHKIYSVLIISSYLYFLNQVYKGFNVFTLSFLYILILYLFLTVQIRYFLAFFLMLNGFYYYYKKERMKYLIFFGLSITNHIGTVLFLPFLLFFKYSFKKIVKYVNFISIISFVLFYVLKFLLGGFFNRFHGYDVYLTKESESTFLGGIFFMLPYIYLMWFLKRRYLENYSIDKLTEFLVKLYVLCFMYMGIAIQLLIIGHRIIIPMYLVFLVACIRLNVKTYKILLITIGLAIHHYIVPIYLFGSSFWLDEIIKMLESIKI
ncbi:EpsG family protein [Myroides marinus]|uniref:EpsG family protein n=1 Tax=Myroides marinus TaxID=703342 RepID=UPI003306F42C